MMQHPFSFTRRQFLRRLVILLGGSSAPFWLPSILQAAGAYPVEILQVVFSPLIVRVGDLLTVSFTIRNNTNQIIQTQGPDPSFIYEQGESFRSYHFNEARNALRVAVDYQDWDGINYPYRWGLGAPLMPGETRTINGRIHLRGPHRWRYWAGVVHEWVSWYQTDVGMQSIESTYAIVNTPTPSPTPTGSPKLVGVAFSPTIVQVGDILSVQFTLKNESNIPLPTQDPAPGFVYDEDDSHRNRFPEIGGAYRVGVDSERNGGFPYRWGFGTALAPGQTATIAGGIRLKHSQTTKFWGGLTREGSGWLQDREGVQTIQVVSSVGKKSTRVVHVHSENATTWNDQREYWNFVPQNVVNDMIERGIVALTGITHVPDAWRKILPLYQPGQSIAIKVNMTNGGNGRLDALPQTINAIVRGLKQIGVRENDIWVYDATDSLPDRFVRGIEYWGVQFLDDGRNRRATFDSADATARINFSAPSSVPPVPSIKVTDVLVNCKYVINVPILKAHFEGGAGLALGFKNHLGSVNNPEAFHRYIFPGETYFRSDYNPLVDLNRNPNIGAKTVLTIGEGLFTGTTWDSLPMKMRTFDYKPPNSYFLSTDPAAIDSVMCDHIIAEWGIPNGADNYLRLANAAGLGVYERGDPWGSGYRTIDYVKLVV